MILFGEIRFDWGWVGGQFLQPHYLVFVGVLVLQSIRDAMNNLFRWFWWALFVPISIWGSVALLEYLPHLPDWEDSQLLIPSIIYGAILAKTIKYFRIRVYALIVVLAFLIPPCVAWLGGQIVDLADQIYQLFYATSTQRSNEHSGGAVGYGIAGLGLRMDELDWAIYKGPGLLIMSCLISVWPTVNKPQNCQVIPD